MSAKKKATSTRLKQGINSLHLDDHNAIDWDHYQWIHYHWPSGKYNDDGNFRAASNVHYYPNIISMYDAITMAYINQFSKEGKKDLETLISELQALRLEIKTFLDAIGISGRGFEKLSQHTSKTRTEASAENPSDPTGSD